MDDKVVLVSTVNGELGIRLPDLNFRRDLPRKGAKVIMDKKIFEEALYDRGFEYMIKTGMLNIEDLEVKKELGLEPEDATEPQNIIVLTEKQMKRLLTVAPLSELKETLMKMSRPQRQNFVDYAVANELGDYSRSQLFKEICEVDLISAIALKNQNKE